MTKDIRILCYLDNDRGRDAEMMLPLVYFIEKVLNIPVEFAFVWDVHAIYRKKPDLVLLPNVIGSPLNYQIAKYAYRQNIKVFALISEGNFRTDGTFNYWGYNRDKKFYEEYICLWSRRTHEFLSRMEPQASNKMVVTGAVGFDRYTIYRFKERSEILEKYHLGGYQKVIGYAGWAFGKLFNKQGRSEIKYLHRNDPNRLKWMEEQMYLVEKILRTVIENNPEILFILKRHPNEANPSIVGEGMNEMVRLRHLPNVLYLKEEENIHDLINISDFWLAFESTTVMESWIMRDNPTLLINPDPDFKRDELYKGSILAGNAGDLQSFIEEYYSRGTIKQFFSKELKEKRAELIRNTIGFGDGLNHIRAGFYFEKTINKIHRNNKHRIFSFAHYIKYILLHLGKNFYIKNIFKALPKFKKTVWIFERFRLTNVEKLKMHYWPFFDDFYKKNSIIRRYNDSSLSKTIIKND
jgi:hypothetical protein